MAHIDSTQARCQAAERRSQRQLPWSACAAHTGADANATCTPSRGQVRWGIQCMGLGSKWGEPGDTAAWGRESKFDLSWTVQSCNWRVTKHKILVLKAVATCDTSSDTGDEGMLRFRSLCHHIGAVEMTALRHRRVISCPKGET